MLDASNVDGLTTDCCMHCAWRTHIQNRWHKTNDDVHSRLADLLVKFLPYAAQTCE